MKTTYIQINNLVWFRRLICAIAVILLIVAVIQQVPSNTLMVGKRPPPMIIIQHAPTFVDNQLGWRRSGTVSQWFGRRRRGQRYTCWSRLTQHHRRGTAITGQGDTGVEQRTAQVAVAVGAARRRFTIFFIHGCTGL